MSRKQHKYHYIYKTINLVNGKYYYGMHSTDNLNDDYIGSGQMLWHAIKKYGRENFKKEILEFFPDRSSLKEREKLIVNEDLVRDPVCMNLTIGGQGGFHSDEEQFKRSSSGGKATSLRLKTDEIFSHDFSKKMSDSAKIKHEFGILHAPDWTGKHHNENAKRKIGDHTKLSQKGEKNSQYGKIWISNLDKKENKRILKSESIPEGWNRGRKIKWTM